MIETARCKIYNQGACKIEEIAEQLKSFENRIDLAVSSWTFRHLVDPVGTFLQTYQLLRPETGLLLMDGFFFSYSGEEWQKTDHDQQITELFLETQAPFLMRQQHDDGAFNHFIVRRPDNLRCRLPMRYGGLQEIRIKSAASRCVTEFQRCSPPKDQPVIHWDACTLFGDKSLYEWLQVNALLEYGNWQILQER